MNMTSGEIAVIVVLIALVIFLVVIVLTQAARCLQVLGVFLMVAGFFGPTADTPHADVVIIGGGVLLALGGIWHAVSEKPKPPPAPVVRDDRPRAPQQDLLAKARDLEELDKGRR